MGEKGKLFWGGGGGATHNHSHTQMFLAQTLKKTFSYIF